MEGALALQLVDEGWKFSSSKKGFGSKSLSGSKRGGGGGDSFSWKSQAQLSRSSSSCSATTSTAGSTLKRQGSVARGVRGGSVKCPSSSSSFARRCAKLVKEQRARFYIVRRCVTMLLCWKDYADV